jgi:hypothetical protein
VTIIGMELPPFSLPDSSANRRMGAVLPRQNSRGEKVDAQYLKIPGGNFHG